MGNTFDTGIGVSLVVTVGIGNTRTLDNAIHPLMMSSTAESLPGLLREWLCRSGMLPLTIYFFHGHDLDSSSSDGYSTAKDIRMMETLEIMT